MKYLPNQRIAFKLLTFLTSASCSLIPETQAAIIRPLDDMRVIEVPISSQGLTRITVKDDRITNVFGAVDEYAMEGDEANGQVFIRPLMPSLKLPLKGSISLTITTESGHTQDLRLMPTDKIPESIILKVEDKKAEITDLITRQEVEELLQACRDERIPVGFRPIPITLEPLKGHHHLVREIKGEKLRCLAYEAKNSSTIPLIMAEESFAKNVGVIAVLMLTKLLHPGEKTYVYVAAQSAE